MSEKLPRKEGIPGEVRRWQTLVDNYAFANPVPGSFN